MTGPRQGRQSERALQAQKERLREPISWFPYIALLPFALVTLLTAHVVFGTNPRLGNPAQLLTFGEEPAEPGAIWISVTPIDDEIVVTTHDRKIFRWPLKVQRVEEIEAFTDYLVGKVNEEIMAAAMAKEAFLQQTRVVIAADRSLRYRHLRPILYAMAKARITNYAFETVVAEAANNKAGLSYDQRVQ